MCVSSSARGASPPSASTRVSSEDSGPGSISTSPTRQQQMRRSRPRWRTSMACIHPNSYHRAVPVFLADVNFDIQFPTDFLGDDGQRAGFLLLTGFLASWLFIRTSARMIRAQVSWWPGNVETSGGLHIHHLVWGILLLMIAGFLGFALQPPNAWMDVLAVLFGIGMGLTLDEFALWLHLEDVYWSDEGRQSV